MHHQDPSFRPSSKANLPLDQKQPSSPPCQPSSLLINPLPPQEKMDSPPDSPNKGKKEPTTHRRSSSSNISPRTNPASLSSMIAALNANNPPFSPTAEGNYTTQAPSTDQTGQDGSTNSPTEATLTRRTPHRTQSVYLGPNGQSPTSLRQQPHERAVAEAQRQLHEQQGPFAPTPVVGGNNSYNVRPSGEQERGTGTSGEGKGGEGGDGKGDAEEKEEEK